MEGPETSKKPVCNRYATSSLGSLVNAFDLRERNGPEKGEIFHCVECERQLIARVKGIKRVPHFAHYPEQTCGGESYLHKTAKLLFQETFDRCVEHQQPFRLTIRQDGFCNLYKDVIGCSCPLDRLVPETFDLTNHYGKAHLEKRDGTRIPDLTLLGRSGNRNAIWVEIKVKHGCEPEKIEEGKRIIEIDIRNEDDLDLIRKADLVEGRNVRLHNFRRSTKESQECLCEGYAEVCVLIVEKSGKCRMPRLSLSKVREEMQRSHWYRHLSIRFETLKFCEGRRGGQIAFYPFILESARQEGLNIQNCHLCWHSEDKFNTVDYNKLYCTVLKSDCKPNDAVSCEYYKERQRKF